MVGNNKILTRFQAAGTVAMVVLGLLGESRLGGDSVGIACLLGLICVGLFLVCVVELAKSSETQRGNATIGLQKPPILKERAIQFEAVIATIGSLLKTHAQDGEAFAEKLSAANVELSQMPSGGSVEKLVLNLLMANTTMINKAEKVSKKLENSRAQVANLRLSLSKAEEISVTDSLTNVGNRRFFDSFLRSEIDRAYENQSALCLILIDLDHFKLVNDKFGHVVGDQLLKLFAALLADNIKGRDKISRYGGEEFAIIAPNTHLAEAAILAGRIRGILENKRWVTSHADIPIGKITASFGVASLLPDEDENSLIQRADAMLYKAKAQGRNRVEADMRGDSAAHIAEGAAASHAVNSIRRYR